jgi:phenylalanyl-tRNA synthetase alpha chain
MSSPLPIESAALQALTQRDLTRPDAGPHALQHLVTAAHTALAQRWDCQRELHRGSALVQATVTQAEQNPDRDERFLAPTVQLRPNLRIHLPDLLSAQALNPRDDLLLICPGVVYRRSPITPLHASEPHQLALWRLRRGRLSTIELAEMLQAVLGALLPGHHYRLLPSPKPHLSCGMRIELDGAGGRIVIGHAGLLADPVLAAAGLDPRGMGALGLTLGLDRILMQRKGIPHIRLLRSDAPAIAKQMLDLQPYRPMADAPVLMRELELAGDTPASAGDIADRIRLLLPPERLEAIEAAELASDKVLRLGLRHHEHPLSEREADAIRDMVAGLIGKPVRSVQPSYA